MRCHAATDAIHRHSAARLVASWAATRLVLRWAVVRRTGVLFLTSTAVASKSVAAISLAATSSFVSAGSAAIHEGSAIGIGLASGWAGSNPTTFGAIVSGAGFRIVEAGGNGAGGTKFSTTPITRLRS